jgi:hypothetical protein
MGRLDVRIVEARNLPNTETFGKPDPYVVVEVENSNQKTSVAASTVNPKWDEVFKFVVADPDSSQLVLKLWNKNLISDDYMGEYKMSLSGLEKGNVKDQWCLLQQCKTNGEIHVRLLAQDFGRDPAPGHTAAVAAPVVAHTPVVIQQQPVVMQQPVYQQPIVMQQPVYQQPIYQQPVMQQPVYQQPMMGFQAQPAMNLGYPGQSMGFGGSQQPSQQWGDFQPVQFTGRVARATYGPIGCESDVTFAVQQLQNAGQNQVFGGIHTICGDPAPGQSKVFKVWYS